ncbi:glycosyl transferase family 2 [Lactobacillus sp. CBA3606]|uniref:glycosyltransferase family 2 protein n=1 Tax=Lactobacillus sp. CBA3606 TaxID=2099789 RepID=UPI000CFDABF9|nr:glycosyltransferase family 2 protein [Lactobacillus sp. CBA3606]AVK63332.1 glycosyl transferase family 2 [Lactobacillus sp. CBA3606]
MSEPLISVIMPVYNSANYIAAAIHSVFAQTYKNLELIIVDDGSTDGTSKIVQSFSGDVRLRYFKSANNAGVASARNIGLRNMRGAYVAFIDSDDIWLKNKLSVQLQFIEKNKIDFTYSYYEIIDSKQETLKIIDKLNFKATYSDLLKTNFIPLLTVLVKSSFLKGLSFKNVKHEDYILWLKLLRNEEMKAFLCPEMVAQYRVHGKSISSNKFKSALWVWNVYRYEEKLSLLKASKNMITYIIFGIRKHRRTKLFRR